MRKNREREIKLIFGSLRIMEKRKFKIDVRMMIVTFSFHFSAVSELST